MSAPSTQLVTRVNNLLLEGQKRQKKLEADKAEFGEDINAPDEDPAQRQKMSVACWASNRQLLRSRGAGCRARGVFAGCHARGAFACCRARGAFAGCSARGAFASFCSLGTRDAARRAAWTTTTARCRR